MAEAIIIINGTLLTDAQAMTIRVAVTTMLAEMSDPGVLGDDEHGRAMASAYAERLREIIATITSGGEHG